MMLQNIRLNDMKWNEMKQFWIYVFEYDLLFEFGER